MYRKNIMFLVYMQINAFYVYGTSLNPSSDNGKKAL